MVIWNNTLCEPVLITYNRADYLDKSLNKFYKLKDQGLILHVLDNCSNDSTFQIVKKWQEKWPELVYHKNTYNIGGNANILRAIEITKSEYIWIIGDDDLWFMDNIKELIEVLNNNIADIIRLGWLVQDGERGKYLPATNLFNSEGLFFASVSMISSTIVRRSLIVPSLPWAYMNILCMYPQLVGIIKAYEKQDLTVYSLAKPLMVHTPSQEPGYFKADLEWYCLWFLTARFFNIPKNQKNFVNEAVRYSIQPKKGKLNEFQWLFKLALNGKTNNLSQSYYLMTLFTLGYGHRLRTFLLIIAYALVPKFITFRLKKLYYWFSGRTLKKLKYDHTRI